MEDNMSWAPRSNDRFGVWKHLLNHMWVTEALNRPQKRPNMVMYGKFSQPYSQYPVRARTYVRNRLFPCWSLNIDNTWKSPIIFLWTTSSWLKTAQARAVRKLLFYRSAYIEVRYCLSVQNQDVLNRSWFALFWLLFVAISHPHHPLQTAGYIMNHVTLNCIPVDLDYIANEDCCGHFWNLVTNNSSTLSYWPSWLYNDLYFARSPLLMVNTESNYVESFVNYYYHKEVWSRLDVK